MLWYQLPEKVVMCYGVSNITMLFWSLLIHTENVLVPGLWNKAYCYKKTSCISQYNVNVHPRMPLEWREITGYALMLLLYSAHSWIKQFSVKNILFHGSKSKYNTTSFCWKAPWMIQRLDVNGSHPSFQHPIIYILKKSCAGNVHNSFEGIMPLPVRLINFLTTIF